MPANKMKSGRVLVEAITDQTRRSLWSLKNVIDGIADEHLEKLYCGMPLWKHVYHTLHSLDRWYIDPSRYEEPPFHIPDLNNLDVPTDKTLSRAQLDAYFGSVAGKITAYLDTLTDGDLSKPPEGGQPHSRLTLIMAQHRHLDMHIGMLMGFSIADLGLWPRVLGIDDNLNSEAPGMFF